MTRNSSSSNSSFLFSLAWFGAVIYILYCFILLAYDIRLYAIKEFGTVIHEFDPYFNFRATEYLYYNGAKRFFTWFDYKVWFPLGRPVGTTIYPGMQFTAVWIKKHIFGDSMSLNDICCYIPAWFGAFASILVGLITYECTIDQNTRQSLFGVLWSMVSGKTNNTNYQAAVNRGKESSVIFRLKSPATECAVFATGIMAIVPAHLTRSVGGGFDNESVAVSAMLLTFYFWVRSLREGEDYSYIYGVFTGFAYFYMAATWGGYVFVVNMIGLHAAILVVLGRFSTKLYLSYSLFYTVGTTLAIQIPVVGMAPLKSLEQVGPLAVFIIYQVLRYCELEIRRLGLNRLDAMKFRCEIFTLSLGIGLIAIGTLTPEGYFGPISSRVRGLFVKHTKTGNPLVDSVAEHQPADHSAYFRFLQHLCTFAPIGFLFVLYHFGDVPSFIAVYSISAYFFSHKMVRLILLLGPVASILGGIAVGRIACWSFEQVWNDGMDDTSTDIEDEDQEEKLEVTKISKKAAAALRRKKKTSKGGIDTSLSSFQMIQKEIKSNFSSPEGVLVKRSVAICFSILLYLFGLSFEKYCWKVSMAIANPAIIIRAQLQNGTVVKLDDYREAYWWIRDNTPEDSRILAWWDYGYQITAIANRTTIADGNTWNHEHIALLGKTLTSPIGEGYNIARHLADYVLIWTGGGADDLAKSPHLARIANSVYRDMCPGDPTCRAFGFVDKQRTPSPMMQASLLYNLHSNGHTPGAKVDPNQFKEVFKSKYGKVRVYQIIGVDEESKSWCTDPSNRDCDIEGGWFCRGQYPPVLKGVLSTKKDFAQLENFYKAKDNVDEEYQKAYFENLQKPMSKSRLDMESQQYTTSSNLGNGHSLSQEKINELYKKWEDTEHTTKMWQVVTGGTIEELESLISSNPMLGHVRSSDGRGPMWWAFEHRRQDMVQVLMKHGVRYSDKDKLGMTPVDLLGSLHNK